MGLGCEFEVWGLGQQHDNMKQSWGSFFGIRIEDFLLSKLQDPARVQITELGPANLYQ